jgi:hypothetical protein
MRFRASSPGGDVVAVTGVNTISFAFLTTEATNKDLLGFAVERADPTEDEKYFMAGFKVFRSVMPNPPPNVAVSTYDQPVQSFVWDDFTAKPDRDWAHGPSHRVRRRRVSLVSVSARPRPAAAGAPRASRLEVSPHLVAGLVQRQAIRDR